jgi:hypothetical protein
LNNQKIRISIHLTSISLKTKNGFKR